MRIVLKSGLTAKSTIKREILVRANKSEMSSNIRDAEGDHDPALNMTQCYKVESLYFLLNIGTIISQCCLQLNCFCDNI